MSYLKSIHTGSKVLSVPVGNRQQVHTQTEQDDRFNLDLPVSSIILW